MLELQHDFVQKLIGRLPSLLILFFGGVVLSLVYNKLVFYIIKKRRPNLNQQFVKAFQFWGTWLILVAPIRWIVIVIKRLMFQTHQSDFLGIAAISLTLLNITLMFIVIIGSAKIINLILEYYFKLKTRRAWESATITPFAKRITIVVSVTVFLLYAMDQIGVNVASIALSLGVGSLAVALAAQETLSNIIAGFIIAIDKPFFVGDRIEILGKCKGDVTQIGLRSTHIRSIDNNVYIVPNLELVKNLILNSSFPTTTKRIVISVSIEYGYDIDFVRRVMLSVLDNEEDVTTENGIPSVHIIDFTDSGVLIKLFFYIKQVHREFDMEFYIREKVYKAFNKEKIVFSYPHLITHSNNPNQKSPQYLEKN